MVGGGVGGLGAGGRVLELDLEAPGAARAARRGGRRACGARAPRAAAAAAGQRHLPHLQVRARLLGVLLPERRRVLHRGHLGQLHLQLRVPLGLRGAALRVQGPGRLVRADEPAADDGDGVHRGRRDRGRVPGPSSLLRRVGAAAAARAGPQAGAGRRGRERRAARAAGGAGGARAPGAQPRAAARRAAGRRARAARAAAARAAGPARAQTVVVRTAVYIVTC